KVWVVRFGRYGSLLEELVGHVARALLARDRGFEPDDLLLEQRDALLQLLDREQRELLADVVGDLFLRAVVVVDHRGAHADLACWRGRASRNPKRSSRGRTSSQKNGSWAR